MASPGNRHCVSCISALSFPTINSSADDVSHYHTQRPPLSSVLDDGRAVINSLRLLPTHLRLLSTSLFTSEWSRL